MTHLNHLETTRKSGQTFVNPAFRRRWVAKPAHARPIRHKSLIFWAFR